MFRNGFGSTRKAICPKSLQVLPAWSAVSSTKSGFLCNSKFHISRRRMSFSALRFGGHSR